MVRGVTALRTQAWPKDGIFQRVKAWGITQIVPDPEGDHSGYQGIPRLGVLITERHVGKK